MGLSSQKDNALLFMITVMVRSAEQKQAAYPKCKAFLTMLRDFARSTDEDLNLDWEYINYADESQDPLATYGSENVKRLRNISREYDPEQVFQKLCRGGFKLSSTSI